MQFGMFYELQLPRPWNDGDEAKLFKNALDWGVLAEKVGIDYAWAQEHHFLEEYSHSTAPEVFLAALSQRTTRMRLGHGVTLMVPNYNHPARIAERLGALDLVSSGRVEWGTGESSSRIELEGFRVNYVEKRAMWAEAVRETAKMMCSEPYAGFEGKYFSMPARNIIPKPMQRPHPPIWVACTNRDTMKLAARLGIGALTFAFMDPGEAKFWVEEYYEIFRNECTPIGRSVNPNIAMLSGLMCHRDSDTAMKRGAEGLSFFAYGLAHYYRFGTHRPGRTSIWEEFKAAPPFPMAGVGGIGNPEQVRESFELLEQSGIDQLICLQQAAGYAHEHICESLELFGKEIIGGFKERHEKRHAKKMAELAPYIEKAMARIPPLEQDAEVAPVEAYPLLWEKNKLVDTSSFTAKRSVGSTAIWKMHVGGVTREKSLDDKEPVDGNGSETHPR
jgi:alkanesulfonate monooxygenase SsuD/methylene tetrahydromethanopterin reductase-like flavin-dependent oxidoreductase (luciferase family)